MVFGKGEFSKDGGAMLCEVPQESVFGRKYKNTPLYAAPQAQQPLTGDMYWNSDDAEKPHDSIECFLNDEICNGSLEVGAEFEIWSAKRLPSIKIKVTSIDEESCEAEYVVVGGIGEKQ